ncbi:MAG: restriction endonuclease subunit S [bacterium]
MPNNTNLIPDGWKMTTLGKIAEIIGGGTPKTDVAEYWNGEIPWLSVVDFNSDQRWVQKADKHITKEGLEKSSTKLLNSGDLIISARGTVGAFAQLKCPMAFNQSCYGLTAKEITENNFLYYLIKQNNQQFKKNVHGAVFDTITRETFDYINILLPPLPEQRAIAAVLSSFDDKIELLREQNKTLEETAQTIFKEWFVKFNFPGATGKMIDSELGEIPEGWRVGRLGELASLKSGFAFEGEDFLSCKSNARVLKIKDLKGSGIIDLSGISYVNEECIDQKRVKYFKLNAGDLVVAMSGNTTGKIGVVPENEDNLFLNQRVGKFFIEELIYRNYLYLFLMSGDYESIILNMGYGSAQPNINPTQIEDIQIIIPTYKLLDCFDNLVYSMMQKIIKNNSQIKSLISLREGILPKLMKGKLRVNNFKEL